MIKVLHTADWHLGKRFEQMDLHADHQYFLDWLIGTINDNQIDVLLVAGDIFDTGNPPNTALKQYYDFLWKVKSTCCKQVVIIGGNHDSVATLNAPKDLLKHLNVHVVGGVPDDINEEIIPVTNEGENTELVICAVPFLRDKDIRLSISGETYLERETRIKEGIAEHYRNLVPLIADYKNANIPIIAAGHLFAAGAKTSDSEKDIHAGNLGQIGSADFPVEFNYIALGHLHRPQMVNKQGHIRYSGSPVALGFSEHDHAKLVLIVSFDSGALIAVDEINVPAFRRCYRIKSDEASVIKDFAALKDDGLLLPAWVEIEVETNHYLQGIEEQLYNIKSTKPFIEAIVIRQTRIDKIRNINQHISEAQDLNDLSPARVFEMRCEGMFPGSDHSALVQTFAEAVEKFGQMENN